MNIILTSVHIEKSPQAIPLAPMLLKGYTEKFLKNDDIVIRVKEFYISDDIKTIAKKIFNMKPDIFGVSIYLWNREFYSNLILSLKRLNPNLIIIAGGADVRSTSNKLIAIGVDYIIQGEGEQKFLKLIDELYNNKVSIGLDYKEEKPISNLDNIPSPLLNGNIELSNYDGYLWELSRGCTFNCDFCFESRGTKGVRYYSLSRVEKELDHIIAAETAQVFVLDPTFNIDKNRAANILQLIKTKNKGTHFHFEIRAELLTNDLAKLFSEIECSLQIGIQSSNSQVLQTVNRTLNKDIFKKKIKLLSKYGITFGLDLIFGLPKDNYAGFKKSMNFVLNLEPNHIDIFPLAILPGTVLKENAKILSITYLDTPPYTITESNTYSKNDMKQSLKLKDACDYIYNLGSAIGWLKQVCLELQCPLIDFIEKFIYYKIDKSKDVRQNILLFICKSFDRGKKELIADMITYHFNYSKALLSEKNRSYISKKDLYNSTPRLSIGGSIHKFNYDILQAFENGHYTIKDIKKHYNNSFSTVVIWFHLGGKVCSEIYSKKIMIFLGCCNGKMLSRNIDKNIDKNFLSFAQEVGLLLFE